MSKQRRWLVAVTVVLLAACGGSTVSIGPATDAGADSNKTSTDGMTVLDSGSKSGDDAGSDTRSAIDSGVGEDSSYVDTAYPFDTAFSFDSGAELDSGFDTGAFDSGADDTGLPPFDSGTLADSHEPFDSGTALMDSGPMDSGQALDSSNIEDSAVADSGRAFDSSIFDSSFTFDVFPFDTGTRMDSGAVDAAEAGTCPATPPTTSSANGAMCSNVGLTCDYPNEVCHCTFGAPVMVNATWHCTMLAAGCPLPEPAIGSACTQAGLTCDYGMCQGGDELVCTAGKWTMGMSFCPP